MGRRTLVLGFILLVAAPGAAHALTARSIALPDGFAPYAAAIGPGGTFYATSSADGDIWRGDLRTGEGDRLVDTTGEVAYGIAFDGRHDSLLVGGGATGQLRRYDSRDGSLLETVVLPGGVFVESVALSGSSVYAVDVATSHHIFRMAIGRDGELGPAEEIPLVTQTPASFNLSGIAVTPSESVVIVLDAEGTVLRVDASTGEAGYVTGVVAGAATGIHLDGRTLWVSQGNDRIIRFELSSDFRSGRVGAVIDNVDAGGLLNMPKDVTGRGGRLLVVNSDFLSGGEPASNVVLLPKNT